jgi:hypothetical protein
MTLLLCSFVVLEGKTRRRGENSAGSDRDSLDTRLGPLKRAVLTWISEFLTGRLSMSVSHLRPKLAFNPETSKKE